METRSNQVCERSIRQLKCHISLDTRSSGATSVSCAFNSMCFKPEMLHSWTEWDDDSGEEGFEARFVEGLKTSLSVRIWWQTCHALQPKEQRDKTGTSSSCYVRSDEKKCDEKNAATGPDYAFLGFRPYTTRCGYHVCMLLSPIWRRRWARYTLISSGDQPMTAPHM
jgi:hypothetical protein